jgi:hypothetical protein
VLAVQEASGALVIGDSHTPDASVSPAYRSEIERLIGVSGWIFEAALRAGVLAGHYTAQRRAERDVGRKARSPISATKNTRAPAAHSIGSMWTCTGKEHRIGEYGRTPLELVSTGNLSPHVLTEKASTRHGLVTNRASFRHAGLILGPSGRPVLRRRGHWTKKRGNWPGLGTKVVDRVSSCRLLYRFGRFWEGPDLAQSCQTFMTLCTHT